MLKVYHAPRTRSMRIVWLLEELGLPYEIHHLEFDPKDLKDPAYLAVHPLGQVPALADNGMVLNESGAITQYLLSKYGNGRLEPAHGTPAYARYLYWLHLAEATMMPQLVNIMLHKFKLPEDQRSQLTEETGQLKTRMILALIEKELAGREYLGGAELSAADITLGYNMHFARMLQIPLQDYPNVQAWYERCRARPGFQKALGK